MPVPLLALVADGPMSLCVSTELPAGFLRPGPGPVARDDAPTVGGPAVLECAAHQETTDGRHALSAGRLRGSDGAVQAVAVGRQQIEGRLPLPPLFHLTGV